MPQFVKYTKQFHDLIRKTNHLVGKTVLGEEDGPSGGTRTIIEQNGNAVSGYDGMFCIRLVKKTEKEINPDTGEEEDVENTYASVDGGVIYVNRRLLKVKAAKQLVSDSDILQDMEDGTDIWGISIRITLGHSSYTEYWDGEETIVPGEDTKAELVFINTDHEIWTGEDIEGSSDSVQLNEGEEPMDDDDDLKIYGIDDKYHSYYLIGRIRKKNDGFVAIQDSWGCPKVEVPLVFDNPNLLAW